MLDSIRYYLALMTVAMLPWAMLFWFLVHPFIGFWRRVGPAVTYIFLGGLGIVMVAFVVIYQDVLMATEFGTGPVLWGLALAFYAVAAVIELRCRKYLSLSMLVGMPELRPAPAGGKLLTEGVYGRVRHPRYVSMTFGMIAVGFFCNYLTLWVLVVLMVPALYGVAVFEERELRDRFGAAYVEYSRRVPRFIPRFS